MESAQEPGTVLIIEDDPITLKMASEYLNWNGVNVLEAAHSTSAKLRLAESEIHLVVLDIGSPDGTSRAFVCEVREETGGGIILVFLMAERENRIIGLEVGVDDHVTKSVEMRELLARIRNILKRAHVTNPQVSKGQVPNGVVRLGSWEIDLRRREAVAPDGSVAPLTRAEFDVVAALVQANGRPASRDYLLDVISRRSLHIGDRTVDTLISRIRQKLQSGAMSQDLILTERGIGYRANIASGD